METIFSVALWSFLQQSEVLEVIGRSVFDLVPAVDAPCWVGDEVVPHDSPDHQDEQGGNQEIGDASPEHPPFLERG